MIARSLQETLSQYNVVSQRYFSESKNLLAKGIEKKFTRKKVDLRERSNFSPQIKATFRFLPLTHLREDGNFYIGLVTLAII